MLDHQLPTLPPVEGFWNELPAFFLWLEGGPVLEAPIAPTIAPSEKVIHERILQLPVSLTIKSYLEIICFSAANHLCIDLVYDRIIRRIEPYSLRQSREGKILLHAHDVNKNKHRSYRLDRIEGVQVTSQSFMPCFEIELFLDGPARIPQQASGAIKRASMSTASK